MGDRTFFGGGGGSGEPFNGGTITDPLVIDNDDNFETPLVVKGVTNQQVPLVEAVDENDDVVFTVDERGLCEITPQIGGGTSALRVFVPATFEAPLVNVQWGTQHILAVGGTDDSGDPALLVTGAADQTVDVLLVRQAAAHLNVLQITYDGKIGFNSVTPVARPEVPGVPTAQDVVDALVALGLVTQAA